MKHTRIACRVLALLVLSMPPHPARAQQPAARADVVRFAERVDAVLSKNGASKAHWGLLVADADSGEVLYARNSNQYFLPASNVKLFTTVMAMATLGPEFRIRTTIESARGVDRMGRLRGDLVLVGRGDANLSNRVFPNGEPYTKNNHRDGPPEKLLAQLADQVIARGVKQIDGDVVADDSDFVPARFPSGWTVDDTVWGYGAAVSAIAVNDNVMTLEVRPGSVRGAPLRTKLEPLSGIYQVRMEAVTTAAGSQPELRLSRDPESRVFVVSGSLPLDAPPQPLVVAVPEPAEHAAALLARLLRARGVRIRGRARARHASDTTRRGGLTNSTLVLAEHISPPLIEDARLTNKTSQNLHAELMLRVAASEKSGAMTMDDALTFASEFLQSIGVAQDDVLLRDGSGLSRNNLVTPQSVVQLLQYALRQSWGPDFVNTLPLAGEDGTLEERMKGTAASGRVQAKSGSLNHVNGLSGYATTARGGWLIFSMFGNAIGASDDDTRAALDMICVAMVEELGLDPEPPQQAPSP